MEFNYYTNPITGDATWDGEKVPLGTIVWWNGQYWILRSETGYRWTPEYPTSDGFDISWMPCGTNVTDIAKYASQLTTTKFTNTFIESLNTAADLLKEQVDTVSTKASTALTIANIARTQASTNKSEIDHLKATGSELEIINTDEKTIDVGTHLRIHLPKSIYVLAKVDDADMTSHQSFHSIYCIGQLGLQCFNGDYPIDRADIPELKIDNHKVFIPDDTFYANLDTHLFAVTIGSTVSDNFELGQCINVKPVLEGTLTTKETFEIYHTGIFALREAY